METYIDARVARKLAGNAPRSHGRAMRITGTVLAVLSLFFVVMQFTDAAGPAPLPWVGVAVGFGLIVVGYLQKIAAK